MDSLPGHPGELLLFLAIAALLALGLLLFVISARAMVRLMNRLDHPDEPMPPLVAVSAWMDLLC